MSESKESSNNSAISFSSTNPITLQIGQRRFVTTWSTITPESGFFSSLLSRRWNSEQADGSYFIDADPELFEHILRYLRRGVLPVFYDKSTGYDHALYFALLREAKYFQITRLQKWIEDKTYLQSVKVVYSAVEFEGINGLDGFTSTDVDVEYHPVWKTRKIYVCPRDIFVHRGNPTACGRSCRKAQGDVEDQYVEEEVLKTLIIRKQTIFNQEICVEGPYSCVEE
ncbi:MAG: hypothetical protein M1834_005199 [Cirrosporium novae-zelandiae]|nr:MAG: hypothetical protein M1834_005199 [Cirrosporium novae-zelandiae]